MILLNTQRPTLDSIPGWTSGSHACAVANDAQCPIRSALLRGRAASVAPKRTTRRAAAAVGGAARLRPHSQQGIQRRLRRNAR